MFDKFSSFFLKLPSFKRPPVRHSKSSSLPNPLPQQIASLLFFSIKVLSGDSVVIRGQPRGGPPPERQLCLSNVNAPKLARRSNPNVEGSVETRDEVCLSYNEINITALLRNALCCLRKAITVMDSSRECSIILQ